MSLCVIYHSEQGHLSQASLIWTRHFNTFKSVLSEASVITLLNAVPAGMKVCDLITWLQHFIPSVLRVTPQSLQHVIIWTMKSIKYVPVGYELFLQFCIFRCFISLNPE
jgi:hypothetical protein